MYIYDVFEEAIESCLGRIGLLLVTFSDNDGFRMTMASDALLVAPERILLQKQAESYGIRLSISEEDDICYLRLQSKEVCR